MAAISRTYSRIVWENYSSTNTPLNEANLNKMDLQIYRNESNIITLNSTKAETTALNALSTEVSKKAAKSELSVLNAALNGKADTTAITALTRQLALKADQSALNQLSQRVDTKADKTALNAISSTVNTKADQSDLLQSLKSVSYDEYYGIFTFEWWNGRRKTVDLNIEKIPVSFRLTPQGVLIMRTADGTEYTADIAAILLGYDFQDSTEIMFNVRTAPNGVQKIIKAEIVDGSITDRKIQPNYLAEIKEQARIGRECEAASMEYAGLAESYAVGTGGEERPEDDYDNAKYYSEVAESLVSGNIMLSFYIDEDGFLQMIRTVFGDDAKAHFGFEIVDDENLEVTIYG